MGLVKLLLGNELTCASELGSDNGAISFNSNYMKEIS